MKSPWLWLIEGKIIGADELRAKALKSGKFDYDAPIAGLEVVDRYTLRIRLKRPDLRFLYVFAVPNTAAVAREVVEAYGQDFGAHPVGTGSVHARRVQAQREDRAGGESRLSRHDVCAGGSGAAGVAADRGGAQGQEAAARRAHRDHGHRGRAGGVARVRQPRARLLDRLPGEFVEQALANGKLRPDLAAKGIRHEVLLRPNTRWTYFNMEDPVVGGYTPEKIALRRAIGMGYDVDEFIRVILKGRGDPGDEPASA